MADVEGLICKLAKEASPVAPLSDPSALSMRVYGVLIAYALVVLAILGIRPDIAVQLQRPFYAAEIAILLGIMLSGARAAIYLASPDLWQRPQVLRVPLYMAAGLIALLTVQFFLPSDARMVFPIDAEPMECALCIGAAAIIPSALLFVFLRKGASVRPLIAGTCAVLAAASAGSIALRLAEANDALMHLTLWHYLPTLAFAVIGALTGKYCLKW